MSCVRLAIENDTRSTGSRIGHRNEATLKVEFESRIAERCQ